MPISAGRNQENDGKEAYGFHPASKRVLPGWDSSQGEIPPGERDIYRTSLLSFEYICGNQVSQWDIRMRRFNRTMMITSPANKNKKVGLIAFERMDQQCNALLCCLAQMQIFPLPNFDGMWTRRWRVQYSLLEWRKNAHCGFPIMFFLKSSVGCFIRCPTFAKTPEARIGSAPYRRNFIIKISHFAAIFLLTQEHSTLYTFTI
jgi:hypothetical protein